MTLRLETQDDVDSGVRQLVKQDPRLEEIVAVAGRIPLRRRPGGFAGLAQIIVAQQLSTASAGAIWARLTKTFDPLAPDKIRRARTATLARIGLSAAKIRAFKAIAGAIRDGLDLDALADMPADEAHRALTALHGVGPWTADIYLLFCLGHADAWPAGDLAVQEAMRLAFKLDSRPSAKEMAPLAEGWRPRRGVAALILWTYYRAVKKRDAVPIPPTPPTLTTSTA
ncbi:MAG TPA: DNA-3-methyladenine glycosylase 2 family protein [Xanthobacteraceae bacterium]|nr:DNA-3-methyladenine glycosylase 2 family protein [Xanthobacteraceae bacterium]